MSYDCTNCKRKHYRKDHVFNCDDCKTPICVHCVMGMGFSKIYDLSSACPTCHVQSVIEALNRDLACIPLEAINNISTDNHYIEDTMPDVFLNFSIGVKVKQT